jgi:hypothetical protein
MSDLNILLVFFHLGQNATALGAEQGLAVAASVAAAFRELGGAIYLQLHYDPAGFPNEPWVALQKQLTRVLNDSWELQHGLVPLLLAPEFKGALVLLYWASPGEQVHLSSSASGIVGVQLPHGGVHVGHLSWTVKRGSSTLQCALGWPDALPLGSSRLRCFHMVGIV